MNLRSLLCGMGVVAVSSIALSAEPSGEEMPRYRLNVGDKITYNVSGESKGEASFSREMSTMEFTVLRENADHSRHLLVHSKSSETSSYSKDKPARTSEDEDWNVYDVFPDGRPASNKKGAGAPSYSIEFPALPPDSAAMTGGWTIQNEEKLQTNAYRPVSDSSGEFVFSNSESGMMCRLYLLTRDNTFHFDRAKGLISHVDSKYSQGYGFNTKGSMTCDLKAVESIDAATAAQMASDYDLLYGDNEYYKPLADAKTAEEVDAAIAKIKQSFQLASDTAKTEAVKKEFASRTKNLDDEASYYKKSAEDKQKQLNQPAPAWTATDLEGKPQSMEAYKGKIVVMDFWYRGCGWCMFATPQVKQLAADYKDKGVVVLGMNTDRKEEDAKFVAKEFEIGYPIVKAADVPDKFGIHGFPTLVIVDQSGVVREFHVGYSTTLRVDVGKKIDELLNAAK